MHKNVSAPVEKEVVVVKALLRRLQGEHEEWYGKR